MDMSQRIATATAVRRAAEYDLVELLRLRALLFDDLAGDFFNPATDDGSWLDALAVVLKDQLTADDVRILVVDADGGRAGDQGGGLAACGIGTIEQRLPGPHLPNGRIGQVIGVVTDPAHRRRGHSRAVMRGLLDWFQEREVARVDLHASPEGEPLYRALGFTAHPDPSLYWRPC
ncbi:MULTISPECIES: GNAT family N-acetyltransferase [Streptomyces]|uniref:GNAT family N-acetyltransferase n=1 Tax=Streptomyces spinosisporus TaxID=2927582 RepID=A0ABS9XKR6_9ACTN|nr:MULTISPECIES: GNAT family N-acetyltransferase [Streptomyces]MCI3242663.1 GNAT family N-acetyltransferase [Streptomyces spinosisporus]WUB40042.1 GNAT family N-acetyltransferase [Streptomyces sp. NBC_00588]